MPKEFKTEPASTLKMGGQLPNLSGVERHFAFRKQPAFPEDPVHELVSGLYETMEELKENVPVQPANSELDELSKGTVYVAEGGVGIDSHGFTDGIAHQ